MFGHENHQVLLLTTTCNFLHDFFWTFYDTLQTVQYVNILPGLLPFANLDISLLSHLIRHAAILLS